MLSSLEAIVLRTTPFEEGGLVVSFLGERGERLAGLARGARKPSSRWVSSFEPLGLVRLGLFGKEHVALRRITRCDLVHSPLVLGHLESNLVVACLADCFDRIAREGVEDDRLFRLLSACSRSLKARPERAMAVLAYAEHWLLHCLGLLPRARTCGRCGGERAPLALLSEDHGWICADCTPVDPSEALPPGTREHLARLRTVSVEEAPDPAVPGAPAAVTAILRGRLMGELGNPRSYDVLHRLLAGPGYD
jgi:DNA repair protein RecO (recombination protein O)